jgi:hypothetical protein
MCMETEKRRDKWEDICFQLSKNVKPDIDEKFYEQKILMILEKMGWHESKGKIEKRPPIQIGRGNTIQPDLVLYGKNKQAAMVIEVKRPSEDIKSEKFINQLIS